MTEESCSRSNFLILGPLLSSLTPWLLHHVCRYMHHKKKHHVWRIFAKNPAIKCHLNMVERRQTWMHRDLDLSWKRVPKPKPIFLYQNSNIFHVYFLLSLFATPHLDLTKANKSIIPTLLFVMRIWLFFPVVAVVTRQNCSKLQVYTPNTACVTCWSVLTACSSRTSNSSKVSAAVPT